jgi:hypothetical protein
MIFIWQALVFFLGGGHGRHINMEDNMKDIFNLNVHLFVQDTLRKTNFSCLQFL